MIAFQCAHMSMLTMSEGVRSLFSSSGRIATYCPLVFRTLRRSGRSRGIGIGAMHWLAPKLGLIEAIDSRLQLLKIHLPACRHRVGIMSGGAAVRFNSSASAFRSLASCTV